MKLAVALFKIASVVALAADLPNTLSEAEREAGWRLLFDGQTTEGWIGLGSAAFPDKGWRVDAGTLHHTSKGGGGDIVTREHFLNFELAWEWKIARGANSGLKYNLTGPASGLGFEYQMIDDSGYPGAKGLRRTHLTAGLYDLIEPASETRLMPAGEWNASRVLVQGNHVEHWLNGAKTAEFEIASEALKAWIAKSKYREIPRFGEKVKSPILIQDHGDEVWVRSIKLRPL